MTANFVMLTDFWRFGTVIINIYLENDNESRWLNSLDVISSLELKDLFIFRTFIE